MAGHVHEFNFYQCCAGNIGKQKMNPMMQLLFDLTPLNRVFCSRDYDKAIEYIRGILPFRVLKFSSNMEHNGWVIPPKWDVKEARIIKNGDVIYDGLKNPLSVLALSRSFCGEIDCDELKQHLYYDHRYPDAIPYHFRQEYQSWLRDWGFCVTSAVSQNSTCTLR